MDEFERQLAALRSAIQSDDSAAVEKLLTAAKKNRDALGS
jgi:hypothetical protein